MPTSRQASAEPRTSRPSFQIRAFGKLAETCEKVKKGVEVLVDGNLDIREYTDKEGQKRVTFRILADTYRLL